MLVTLQANLKSYNDDLNNKIENKKINNKIINDKVKEINEIIEDNLNNSYNQIVSLKEEDVILPNFIDQIQNVLNSTIKNQNALLRNIFKNDKETLKSYIQTILSKFDVCFEYREATKNNLTDLEKKTFTNLFKSLVDNLTAQSEDFQNIYKSNINKFNNIILQNIDILHPH